MPVHHKRLVPPEIKGELYHGPIDGVRPEDHWNTYYYLRRLRCSLTSRGPVFQHIIDHQLRFCFICFFRVHGINRSHFTPLIQHGLIHERAAYTGRCRGCNRRVMSISPAYRCLGCVEEYLNADRTPLEAGIRIPSVKRWLELLKFK